MKFFKETILVDFRTHAEQLLTDYNACCQARPKHNAVGVQLAKDSCAQWANYLNTQLAWGSDLQIAEACHQLEYRLRQLSELVIMESLTHGII
jgi:hypothetical protein